MKLVVKMRKQLINMEKEITNIKVYKWDFEGQGLFEATVTDGELTDIRFNHRGSLHEFSNGLGCHDIDFLKAVQKALKELFKELK